jgi:hypothetical protein
MPTVIIPCGDRNWTLTTDHALSSYGIPVLLDDQGHPYGPWDYAIDNPDARGPFGEPMPFAKTARAIAGYAKDDHPDDPEIVAMVNRFLAVKGEPPGRPA